MGQGKVIGGVCRCSLDGKDCVEDMFHLGQVGYRVIDIAGRHPHIQDDAVTGVRRLVREIVLPAGFPGALHVTRLRLCLAHSLLALPPVSLDLLCSRLASLARPALQLLQPFLIGAQPFPVHPGALHQLHLLL